MSKHKIPEYLSSDHVGWAPRATSTPVPARIADVALGKVKCCLQRGEKAAAIAAIEAAFRDAGIAEQFEPDTPVASLEGIPPRALESLEAAGVRTVLALESLTSHQLRKLDGIGEYAVDAIRDVLAKIDRTLRNER